MTYVIKAKGLKNYKIVRWQTTKDGAVRVLLQLGKIRVWHTVIDATAGWNP